MLLIYVDMRDKYVYMKIINVDMQLINVNNKFAHIQLQLSLFFLCVRYTNLFCLGFFRLNESIGLLCTGVKYLILTENKYTR